MVKLEPVDAVEVTLVVDNFVDVLLAGSEGVRRFPLAYDFFHRDQLVAEHGFSALVTVVADGRRSSILYDGGMTPRGLANNLEVMEVDPAPGCGPSSSPTATSTTTAVWRAWPPAADAAACPC
jgi:7,8-dihydropterin-6-yl-methyl-4-(beta-D-ribofuranosyl)aminobenzene 5'-phosphate synthase